MRKKKNKRGAKRKTWERRIDKQFFSFRQKEHMAWSRMIMLLLMKQRPMYRWELCEELVKITGYTIKPEQLQRSMNDMLTDGIIEIDRVEKKSHYYMKYLKPTEAGLRQLDLMIRSFLETIKIMKDIIEE